MTLLPWALGAGILALLFWPRNASAATNPPGPSPAPGPRPVPGPGPAPGPIPGNLVVGGTARVNSNYPATNPSLYLRATPALKGAVVAGMTNPMPNGTPVTILQMGITPTDNSGGEWWQLRTATGQTGYSRAVDPTGYHNFA